MRPFGLVLSLAPLAVVADVQFTSPAAGAKVPVGTINVEWKESGIAPLIQDLTAYTLVLMLGGNSNGDMLSLSTFRSQGIFTSGNNATGTISSGISGPLTNGFFFQILSSSTTGGEVINYSDRFTITGLTGATVAQQYRDAVAALQGSTKGPPSVGDAAASSTSSALPTSTTATQQSQTSMVTTTKTNSATSTPTHSSAASSQSSGGLSSGALVGIAIAGVVVGLVGLILALWTCLRRKRRKDQGLVRLDDNSDLSAEVFRKEMTVTTPPVELDPYSRIVEADHGTPPAELPSMNVRVELEGDSIHGADIGRPDTPLTEAPQTPISPMTLGTGTGTWDSIRFGLPDPSFTPETPGTPVTPRDNV